MNLPSGSFLDVFLIYEKKFLKGEYLVQKIKKLSEHSINRIAAGEVIERPASAVKELVENAIDAGATQIEVIYSEGGKSLLKVTDDGVGIIREDLSLAIQRHATSKISDLNLDDIKTLGFRGEALPSMGAAGLLSITSRFEGSDSAYSIRVDAGVVSPVKPAALSKGTIVELTRLFHSTPARLKFLRTERSEARAISDMVKSLALAAPGVGFTLIEQSPDGKRRKIFSLESNPGQGKIATKDRLNRLIDKDFAENSFRINGRIEEAEIEGFCTLPTFTKGISNYQFFFVNGRPVKDRLLHGALRGAYVDHIAKNRYPMVVLYLTYPADLVDVNVHPTKAEVRFRNPSLIRALIVKSIQDGLYKEGHRSAPAISSHMMDKVQASHFNAVQRSKTHQNHTISVYQDESSGEGLKTLSEFPPWLENALPSIASSIDDKEVSTQFPLGAAIVQFHEKFIVSQTNHGIIIVDQHAAHERLVYERLKKQLAGRKSETKKLLVPEIIEFSPTDAELIIDIKDELAVLGLVVEEFGQGAICVREVPSLLGNPDVKALLQDILEGIVEGNSTNIVEQKINSVISRMSCHGSIRAGKTLTIPEMNEMLREMEKTPHSGQCNHGRPTYIEMKLTDIEKLFGRT